MTGSVEVTGSDKRQAGTVTADRAQSPAAVTQPDSTYRPPVISRGLVSRVRFVVCFLSSAFVCSLVHTFFLFDE